MLFGRYSGDRQLEDRILAELTSGRSATVALGFIPELGHWRHPHDHYALIYQAEDGERVVVGSPVAAELVAVAEPGAPWDSVPTGEADRILSCAELPPAMAARAAQAGLTEVWVEPVDDPLHGRPAVILAFGRAPGSMEVHRYPIEIMRQMLTLILQWREHDTAMRRAARRDPLTGLANRTGFWEVLEALERPGAEPRVAILFIDLDGFKGVNDAHGHRAGDLVLAEVAQRIAALLRPVDVVARLGGDEFAVLCPGLVDDAAAVAIAERLVQSVGGPIALPDLEVVVGASIGIATTAEVGQRSADELLDAADRALYHAKAAGRGRWHLAPTAV